MLQFFVVVASFLCRRRCVIIIYAVSKSVRFRVEWASDATKLPKVDAFHTFKLDHKTNHLVAWEIFHFSCDRIDAIARIRLVLSQR